MFPAHAGMNRTLITNPDRSKDVPRTRGDEPSVIVKRAGIK